VGELADLGSHLDPVAWSPVPGDDRLLFMSALGSFERPAILVRHEFEDAFELHRVELESGETLLLAAPDGEILDAAVRPDGDVWYLTSDHAHLARTVNTAVDEMLAPRGERAPAGRPFRSFWFENADRLRIQASVVTPPGDGHPTVMSVHGGPEWHDRDAFDPET
jgi:dipeptidyl aminopeptidase/acylaminoacyl peptidase